MPYKNFASREEMLNSGYQLDDRDSACRDCGSAVTWGQTPNGKRILLDGNDSARVHWDHCRKGQAAPSQPPPTAAPRNQQVDDLREPLAELAAAVRALNNTILLALSARQKVASAPNSDEPRTSRFAGRQSQSGPGQVNGDWVP